jgi:hypothetical protein
VARKSAKPVTSVYLVIALAVEHRGALVEKADRDTERLGDLVHAADCDPVRPLLVFLDLLARDAAGVVPELFLADTKEHASHANAGADVLVDGIPGLDAHSTAHRFDNATRGFRHALTCRALRHRD